MPLDREQAQQLKRFGASLRRERIRLNITQEKFGEMVELNIRTVQKIEAGQVNILVTTAMRIKGALGCEWEELTGDR